MRYFSVFSGVGGFELGMPKDWECVGHSEIDQYAAAVLRYNFCTFKNYGDITKINWNKVPDFDLLVGGSPCQDLSVAGKRVGLGGSRSGLFGEYIKALEIKKPAYFIWENVKGSMSSNGGRDFATILNSMAEAGYATSWQVLNAKDFGVPQNRERVFVIGSRNQPPREVFFEGGAGEIHRGVGEQTQEVATACRAKQGGPDADHTYVRQPLRFLKRNQKNIEGDYAFTVDAGQTSGIRKGDRVRRLTPKECERLMSWPDDWTRWGAFQEDELRIREISDTQRYKMCGNGVVSKVVQRLIEETFL